MSAAETPKPSTSPTHRTAALPSEVADALAEAALRGGTGSLGDAAIDRIAAQWPEHRDAIRQWLQQVQDASSDHGDCTGERIGPYEAAERIGRGGFGEVYRAFRVDGLRREVALKVLKLGMDSRAILRRFERERDALARMNHDAIAKVYEAGTTERGRPWFAMELVEGIPITRFCSDRSLSLPERLRLFVEVCLGAQHAHQKGVVHRDIKPGNVLVGGTVDRPSPKLIDFGIARAVAADDDAVDATRWTEVGALVGTPAYMAPEQFDPLDRQVDTRADVFALGALLFELATGHSALYGFSGDGRDFAQVRAWLRDGDPPIASRAAAQSRGQEAAWASRLRGDLDWIAQRAMAREPQLRYASAAALAADVERHLADQPVEAGPPSARYQFRKFVQRHRGTAIAIAAVLATAVAGFAVSLRYAWIATQRADDNLKLADEKSSLAKAETEARGEAQKQAAAAQAAAAKLEAKVRDFDQLSCLVLLESAKEAARSLQPAWPVHLPAMRKWLDEDAAYLLAQRPRIDVTIADLQQEALAWSVDEQKQDRLMHAEHDRLVLAQREIATLRHQAEGAKRSDPWPLPDLGPGAALSAMALNAEAWHRISPKADERNVHGEELLGLAYALLAAERGRESQFAAQCYDTLAWAYVANGRDREAMEAAGKSVDAAPDASRAAFASKRGEIEAAIASRSVRMAETGNRLKELEQRVGARRTWSFGSAPTSQAAAFLLSTLRTLRSDLDAFEQKDVAVIKHRMAWAECLAAGLSSKHPRATCTWDEVRRRIANHARYADRVVTLRDEDLMDLVPIGENPATGLFEAYHLASAWDQKCDPLSLEIPTHAKDGSLAWQSTPGSGVVFVLVPGRDLEIGAQGINPDAERFDPEMRDDTSIAQVSLDAYWIARHELTQLQWTRLWRGDAATRRPSHYHAGVAYANPLLHSGDLPPITQSNPVESVTWHECTGMLREHGLTLPTDAQWEHAGRGGADTPWWPGSSPALLQGRANLLDQSAAATAPQFGEPEPFDDGHVIHAPVGSFLPNAFGLYDVHGNVWEWCMDGFMERGNERVGDGLRRGVAYNENRILRGGCYSTSARNARFAETSWNAPGFRNQKLGLRAARSLHPTAELR